LLGGFSADGNVADAHWNDENRRLKLNRNDDNANENDGIRLLMRVKNSECFLAIQAPCGVAQ